MPPFRWGIFGTGPIAYKFGLGLRYVEDAEIAFVASRSAARAVALAGALSAPRAIEGYAAAAAEGEVDAVYIATPPAEHVRHALLCLNSGLPVLVEKPFAQNLLDAESIAEAAKSRGLFAMEAMWTRFLPAASEMRERVLSGVVGEVHMVLGSFGTSWLPEKTNGMFVSALGGGALAHLGSYPLSLGQWMFGTAREVRSTAVVGSSGVDEDVAIQVKYASGVIGSFAISLRSWARDDFQVLGSDGVLSTQGSIVRPHGLVVTKERPQQYRGLSTGLTQRFRQVGLVHRVAQTTGKLGRPTGKRLPFHYVGNGLNYQASEVQNCIRLGQLESGIMPLKDSVSVAATMEKVRRSFSSGRAH